jgi:hypothetical protein
MYVETYINIGRYVLGRILRIIYMMCHVAKEAKEEEGTIKKKIISFVFYRNSLSSIVYITFINNLSYILRKYYIYREDKPYKPYKPKQR